MNRLTKNRSLELQKELLELQESQNELKERLLELQEEYQEQKKEVEELDKGYQDNVCRILDILIQWGRLNDKEAEEIRHILFSPEEES